MQSFLLVIPFVLAFICCPHRRYVIMARMMAMDGLIWKIRIANAAGKQQKIFCLTRPCGKDWHRTRSVLASARRRPCKRRRWSGFNVYCGLSAVDARWWKDLHAPSRDGGPSAIGRAGPLEGARGAGTARPRLLRIIWCEKIRGYSCSGATRLA